MVSLVASSLANETSVLSSVKGHKSKVYLADESGHDTPSWKGQTVENI